MTGLMELRGTPMPVADSNAAFRKRSRTADTPAAPVEPVPTPVPQCDKLDGDPNFMTSLARGLAVIQAFSQAKRQLTISQISAKTGFSRAAGRRCIYTLSQHEFSAPAHTRHFHLRPQILTPLPSHI